MEVIELSDDEPELMPATTSQRPPQRPPQQPQRSPLMPSQGVSACANVFAGGPIDLVSYGIVAPVSNEVKRKNEYNPLFEPPRKIPSVGRNGFGMGIPMTRGGFQKKYSQQTWHANRIKSGTNIDFMIQTAPLSTISKPHYPVRTYTRTTVLTKPMPIVKRPPMTLAPTLASVFPIRKPPPIPPPTPPTRGRGGGRRGRPRRRAVSSSEDSTDEEDEPEIMIVGNNEYMIEASGEIAYRIDSFYDDRRKFKGAYTCTFNPKYCNRGFKNAFEFINHLVSHVTSPAVGEDDKLKKNQEMVRGIVDEFDNYKKCKQCLTMFATPYLFQVHYLKCHSKPESSTNTACHICEYDFSDELKKNQHLSKHKYKEAPYWCQRCSYRTSIRTHLLDHYIRDHMDDGSLMCPYCTHVVEMPANCRKKDAIKVPDFVEHMKKHRGVSFPCDRCALRFISKSACEEHKEKHHVPIPSKWTSTVRPVKNWKKKFSEPKKVDLKKSRNECIKTLVDRRRKKAPLNTDRGGFRPTEIGKDAKIECPCGFKTSSAMRIASHLRLCKVSKRNRAALRFSPGAGEPKPDFGDPLLNNNSVARGHQINDLPDDEELEEARKFGALHHLAHSEVLKKEKKDAKKAKSDAIAAAKRKETLEWSLDARKMYLRLCNRPFTDEMVALRNKIMERF
ncbi:unnamed protein product [Caenorhabditis auriculariae]|uniref:C2H2-type domain-containing protein n=1 Tax=Caenorhabditis auriculariae TaxID=2777116 RepID=A0A8S1GPU8_9PELO|nr:unnamed protein product [Caenorhabditis auriculariae]